MGSRLRTNPEHVFEVFLEVAKPDGDKDTSDTFIVQKYPPTYDDEDTLKSAPSFAFPCETERYTTTVDHFTFVLTDLESKYKFGYCRYATGAQTCLCIVSFLPWFEVFYNLLNLLAEMINRSEDNDVTDLLRSAYANGVPSAGLSTNIVAGQESWNFTAPDLEKLPCIPSSRNLTEYYNAVDTEKMMTIFASMLNERRIVITSTKLSRLTACVHASASLLYPMHWQHLFIPVLPAFLIDYLSAPMPYVIGVHKMLLQKFRESELGDAVIIDVDENNIKTEFDDFNELPTEICTYLKKHLKSEKIRAALMTSGDAIPKAFLMSLVKLIGGYRDALKFHPGEEITFNPEAFVQSRPESMQPFLEKILHLQIFQQFINERLDMLNGGEGFTDIFEREAMTRADKLNTQSRYKEWLHNVKSQGKKIQRGGKDVWSDFKIKAAPVMTNAMDHIKGRAGQTFHDFKARISDFRSKDDGKSSRTLSRQRPTTINLGQELRSQRPQRPTKSPDSQSLKGFSTHHQQKVSHYKIIEEQEKSQDDMSADLPYNRVSINLLADPDIQNALNKSASAEDLIKSPKSFPLIDITDGSDSSCNSSPAPSAFPSLIDIETTSIGSTGTQDSYNAIPFMDSSDNLSTTSDIDSVGPRPVPPPRPSKAKRNTETTVVKDRLIGMPSKDRPKPAPRKSLSEEQVQDLPKTPVEKESIESRTQGPLIKLDSVDDDLDPFSSPKSKTVSQIETLRSLETSTDDDNLSSALKRTAAFKKQNGRPSKVQTSIGMGGCIQNHKSQNVFDSFDPLSETNKEIDTQHNNDKPEPRKSVHELMHTWELHNIVQNQSSSVGTAYPPSPRYMTNQSLHQPLARVNMFPANQIRQSSINMASSNISSPCVSTPSPSPKRPSSRTSEVSSDRSSDPFSEMLQQSLTSREESSPKKNWETFE